MQGAITTLEGLRDWFYTLQTPFWTLRYYKPGGTGERIALNDSESNLDGSWSMLSRCVADQSRNSRAQMQVLVYEAGKANNYKAMTNLELNGSGAALAAVAGIGTLPQPSKADIDSRIAGAVEAERERWELQARIAQLEEERERPDPADKIISVVERLANTPVGTALIARIMGVPLQPVAVSNVAGTPKGHNDSDSEEEDTFAEDIDATAEILGVSDVELAAKLRKLVETNPAMAKNLLNSV